MAEKINDPSWFYELNVREALIDGVIEIDSDKPKISGKFFDKNLSIEGPAIIRYPDGSDYIGKLSRNKRMGRGVLRMCNGIKVVGIWFEEGVIGKMIWNSDSNILYSDGTFKFDHDGYLRQSGCGVIVYRNGSKYEGEIRNDTFEGIGRLTYQNGDMYEGYFVDNKFEGWGRIVYKIPRIECQGRFENGLRSGEMIYINDKGTEFKGWFENDMMQFIIVNTKNSHKKLGKYRIITLISEVKFDYKNHEYNCYGLSLANLFKYKKNNKNKDKDELIEISSTKIQNITLENSKTTSNLQKNPIFVDKTKKFEF